jgi:hypothetical protein
MDCALTRRHVIRLMAGIPLLAAATNPASAAKTALIERLIEQSRALPRVSQRIDFISGKLLGIRYRADTLIGGPKHPEQFVVRDDAFDCVTFCEVALAAALARNLEGFETLLRRIRYDHGNVQYDRRNHYFADWCRRNIDNGLCRPVPIAPSTMLDKTVTWHREFGRHRVSITEVGRATLFGNVRLLMPGDIIGFVSRRPSLDFYHTGLIAFGPQGEFLLRHASRSKGRVVEQTMAAFARINPVTSVTLLRATDPAVARR